MVAACGGWQCGGSIGSRSLAVAARWQRGISGVGQLGAGSMAEALSRPKHLLIPTYTWRVGGGGGVAEV